MYDSTVSESTYLYFTIWRLVPGTTASQVLSTRLCKLGSLFIIPASNIYNMYFKYFYASQRNNEIYLLCVEPVTMHSYGNS